MSYAVLLGFTLISQPINAEVASPAVTPTSVPEVGTTAIVPANALSTAETVDVLDPPSTIDLPESGKEVSYVSDSIKWIIKKFKAKEYGPAIAAVLMLLLTIANLILLRLGKEIKKHWMPTLSIVTGIGVALAARLATLAPHSSIGTWVVAILQGAMIGMAAVGAWEILGQYIFKKFLNKTRDKVASKKEE